jgi:subtilisin family serine protease
MSIDNFNRGVRFVAIFLFLLSFSFFVNSEVIKEKGVDYISINISEGLNLISGISFDEEGFHKNSEVNRFSLWKAEYWDAENQEFVEIRPIYSIDKEIDPLLFYSGAFFVYSGIPGKLIYRASPSFINNNAVGGYYSFFKGDNLIAINDEMYGKSVFELRGDCDVLGVNFWDSEKQDWKNFSVNDKLDFKLRKELVGLGINVKVKEDCRFFEDDDGIFVSVSTQKDVYDVGEVIFLSGVNSVNSFKSEVNSLISGRVISDFEERPPLFDNSIESSYNYNSNYVYDKRPFVYSSFDSNDYDGDFYSINKSTSGFESDGYIIELENEPIFVKKNDLEEISIKNENSFFNRVPLVRNVYGAFATMPSDVPIKIEKHKIDIRRENERVKEEILESYRKNAVINGRVISEKGELEVGEEFNLVFNGFSLNVSEEEAEEIEKIKGVKKVYPNLEVKAFLSDSVPLIQEGLLAGQLDEDGGDCSISGKECLTGEGVTIAIIDSGVDYTHPDLGGDGKSYNYFDINDKIISDPQHSAVNNVVFKNNQIFWSARNLYWVTPYYQFFTYNAEIFLFDISEDLTLQLTDNNPSEENLHTVNNHIDVFEELMVYVTDYSNGTFDVFVMNLSSNEKTKIITTNEFIFAFSNIYNDLVVINNFSYGGNSNLILFNLSSKNYEEMLNLDSRINYRSNPDIYEDIITYSCLLNSKAQICVYDLILKKETVISDLNYNNYYPRVYMKKIAYTKYLDDTNSNTIIYDLDENKELMIEKPGIQTLSDFSSNKIGYYDKQLGSLFVYDLDFDKDIRITCNQNPIITITAKIEKDLIVWSENREGNFSLYLNNINDINLNCDREGFFPNTKIIGGYDFVNNDNDPMDDYGHGTHCAATAAGDGLLNGVAPNANILAYKVLDAGGSGTFDGVIAGIERAVEDDADILSLSLGGWGNPDDPTSIAVDNAVLAGKVVVVAGGNSGPWEQSIGSPGTARKVITVGATDKSDNLAEFSSRGSVVWEDEEGIEKTIIKPDIVAPGVDVCAAQFNGWLNDRQCLGDEHIAISGTSMATPHIAGAAALLKQKHPSWTPDEIKSALKGTAIDLGLTPIEQGAGRMNVSALVSLDEKYPYVQMYTLTDDNKVKIFATVLSDSLKSYKLYLANDVLVESNSVVDDELIYTISKKDYMGGEYNLILEVESLEGKISKDYSSFEVDNFVIKTLQTYDIYRAGDLVDIGLERIVDFNYDYEVFYSKQSEDDWISASVIKQQDSETGLIGQWDTSSLNDGLYKLKIIFEIPNLGSVNKIIESIYFDSSLKEGWPKRIEWEFVCREQLASENLNYLVQKEENVILSTLPKDFDQYTLYGFDNELVNINKDGRVLGNSDAYFVLSGDSFASSDFCYYIHAGNLEPVIADLNNDGNNEVIVYKGGLPPKILVFSLNGDLLWERGIGTAAMPGGNIPIPLVVDLNNDGNNEIIVFNYGVLGQDSQIFALKFDGSILWETNIPTHLKVSMLMADLNNDGNKEIVIKGNEGERKIIILSSTGEIITLIDLHEKSWGGFIEGSLAIGNFDDDSDYEIVSADPSEFAGAIYDNGNLVGTNNTGRIDVFKIDGTRVHGWPVYTDGIIFSSPVVGDINNDGKDNIVVGLMYSSDIFPDYIYGGLYVFDEQGNVMNGWPVLKGSKFWSSPALGDLNNDSKLEIVTSSLDYYTSLFDYKANLLDGWPKETAWSSYYLNNFADMTGDGFLNILTTAGGIYSCNEYGVNCGGVYAWDLSGNIVEGFPKVTEVDSQSPLTVFEDNGKVSITASSSWDSTDLMWKYRGSVYVWELDASYNHEEMDWPQFQHDSQNTGNYHYKISDFKPRIESKLINNNLKGLSGNLIIEFKRKEGNEWVGYSVLVNQNIELLGNGVLNMASGEDNLGNRIFDGFNNLDVRLNDAGDYRIYVSFENLDKIKREAYWDFKVN